MKYTITVEVDEDKLRRYNGIDVSEESEYEQSIDSLIIQEMGWVDESGIYIESVTELSSDENQSLVTVKELGFEISDIINQDCDEITDGQVVDQVYDLLKAYNIYKNRE